MSFYSWPYPPPPDDDIKSLRTEGEFFIINGRKQHLRGFTDFRNFMLFAKYGIVSPLALQMQAIHRDFVSYKDTPAGVDRDVTMPGVPALSPVTLLMNPWGVTEELNVDSFDPRTFPGYLEKLDQHATLMTKNRFIPTYIILSFTKIFGMASGYQKSFVAQVAEVLSKHICLVDLVLEWNTGDSATDPMDFDKPKGVIISRGSAGEKGDFPYPVWDWCSTHLRRDEKWLQTIADSGYSYRQNGGWGDGSKPAITVPIVSSEHKGFGEPGDEGRSSNTTESFMQGLMSSVWFKSAVFHSEAGTRSQILPTYQQNCAITFLRGCYAVPEVP